MDGWKLEDDPFLLKLLLLGERSLALRRVSWQSLRKFTQSMDFSGFGAKICPSTKQCQMANAIGSMGLVWCICLHI